MTEEAKTALDSVLAIEGAQAQAEAFAALPRVVRKQTYFSLPEATRTIARAIVEARRGVSRGENGELILSDEAIVAKRDRIAGKIAEIETNRLANLKAVLAETEAEIAERGITNDNA